MSEILRKKVVCFEKIGKIEKGKDQHFMIDEKLLKKVVYCAELSKKDTVLEIGPGLGFLTYELCKKAGKVIGIENDRNLVKHLKWKLVRRNFELIHGDGIQYIKNNRNSFNKLVSNLPYAVSEPLIMELINNRFDLCVLTISKTFADNLLNKIESEKATKISIIAQSFFGIKKICDVDKSVFHPQPRKMSALIKIRPINTPEYGKRKKEFVIREIVLQPKKRVKNALVEALINYERKFGNKELTKRSAKKMVNEMKLGKIENKTSNILTTKDMKKIVMILQFTNVYLQKLLRLDTQLYH